MTGDTQHVIHDMKHWTNNNFLYLLSLHISGVDVFVISVTIPPLPEIKCQRGGGLQNADNG